MKRRFCILNCLLAFLILQAGLGCSSDDTNSITGFEPEVNISADNFQFQVTEASNVSVTLTYPWPNSGQQATINHSTATIEGSASVTLFDADGVQVYSAGLAASANDESDIGTAGTWTVSINLTNFSGTANFRVEKLDPVIE